jgi:hypothetical protein
MGTTMKYEYEEVKVEMRHGAAILRDSRVIPRIISPFERGHA